MYNIIIDKKILGFTANHGYKCLHIRSVYIIAQDLKILPAVLNITFDLFSLADSISDCLSIHAIANILNSE